MAENWTTEYPTQPGVYWLRNYTLTEDPAGHFFGPYIGEVSLIDYRFRLAGSTIARGRLDFVSAEWQGPIEPQDAKAMCPRCGEEVHPGCELPQENGK